MRIGLLAYPTHGGSGVIASELAASLAAAGEDVHLVSHAVPPRLAGDSRGVQVHVARGAPYPLFERAPHELALASKLIEEHTREPFDVLHAHYALPHAVVAWLVREAAPAPAPRLVTTLHGTDTNLVGAAPAYRPLLAHALRVSDAVTCVSEYLAREARAVFGLEGDTQLTVLPDFVDVERFHPVRERAPGPVRVLHVSNFRQVKRVPWLLEAFEEANLEDAVHLTLVGEGPERAACEAWVSERGLEGRIRFEGARDDLPDLLRAADLFVLASEIEGFGLSALEAMACGLPVLAPAVGGLPEVLRDDREGRLVPAGDRRAWSASLAQLVGDAGLRARLGAAGRARAERCFERGELVDRYHALYTSLLR